MDDPDLYTYKFGDDVLTDWFQDGDGILESFEIAGPVGLGPLTGDRGMALRLGQVHGFDGLPDHGRTVPMPGLDVAVDDIIVYLKDGAIFIGDTPYTIESNQISDALYSFTLTGEQEVDQKRWANGDQSFDTDAMVPGARTIELECRFAKTPDIVGTGSESDDWMSDQAVNRYVRMEFTSPSEAQGGIVLLVRLRGADALLHAHRGRGRRQHRRYPHGPLLLRPRRRSAASSGRPS